MKREDIDKLKVIPINKMVIMDAENLEANEGIIIPDVDTSKAKSPNKILTVIHVDPNCDKVKIGDLVYPKVTGLLGNVPIGTKNYLCISEDDLALILRK